MLVQNTASSGDKPKLVAIGFLEVAISRLESGFPLSRIKNPKQFLFRVFYGRLPRMKPDIGQKSSPIPSLQRLSAVYQLLLRLRGCELGPHFCDDFGVIWLVENCGASDEGVGARRGNLGDIVDAYATINLKPYILATGIN